MDNKDSQPLPSSLNNNDKTSVDSNENTQGKIEKEPDLAFRIIDTLTEILCVCSIITIPLYLIFLLPLAFQWMGVKSFSLLPFADKTYLVLASTYWMYAPGLVNIARELRKEKTKGMIIPLLILGGCILYVYLRSDVLPVSEQ
jgi:hypothetical protein